MYGEDELANGLRYAFADLEDAAERLGVDPGKIEAVMRDAGTRRERSASMAEYHIAKIDK